MSDRRPDRATPVARRLALVGLSLVVTTPVVLLYWYLLAWFGPELTSPGCDPTAGWRPDAGTLLWVLAALASVVGVMCLAFALVRIRRVGRWWPWPVAAVAVLAAGWPAVHSLPAQAWCPPLS